jgi:NAD(P)-dependent dehydrogenase (short-subunit alcohol dehydrogenase family)
VLLFSFCFFRFKKVGIPMIDIKEKVVIVTGAASGIGRGLCLRFAQEGARAVIAADINEAGAEAVAGKIHGKAMVCDVRKEEDVVRVVRFAEENFGGVDLFCSNAGIALAGGYEVDNASWQRIWEINVLAHVFVARAVIPGMIKRGGGVLMITASAAGLLSQIGSLPYSVTKHAAVGMAENIAIAYGDQGIQVYALCPQAVETEMTRQGAGVAAVDGMITAEQLTDAVMEAFKTDEFLILPHAEVKTYMQRKASDYSRWLKGMRKLQQRYVG